MCNKLNDVKQNRDINKSSRFSSFYPLLIPGLSLLIPVILVLFLSDAPGRALYFFFSGPFGNLLRFGNMLNAMTPLIFGALGVTIAMKAGSLNLGGEGQIYLGAFVTAVAAPALSSLGVFGGIIAVITGVITAGLMAAISGFCKAMWNTNELITSFLLSSAVIPVINYLVRGPFNDPQTSLQATEKIPESMRLSMILMPSNLSSGIFIALAAVIIVHLFLAKTKLGYEFRMAGNNELFARYGGINTKLNTVFVMGLSGGFYGLAGSISVLGTFHAVIQGFSAGLGWNALATALIAAFIPAAVIPAAFFFAWIGAGARAAMQNTGLTFEIANIMQAVILLLSTSLVLKRGKKWKT